MYTCVFMHELCQTSQRMFMTLTICWPRIINLIDWMLLVGLTSAAYRCAMGILAGFFFPILIKSGKLGQPMSTVMEILSAVTVDILSSPSP